MTRDQLVQQLTELHGMYLKMFSREELEWSIIDRKIQDWAVMDDHVLAREARDLTQLVRSATN